MMISVWRIALLGGSGDGKSSLGIKIANHLNCTEILFKEDPSPETCTHTPIHCLIKEIEIIDNPPPYGAYLKLIVESIRQKGYINGILLVINEQHPKIDCTLVDAVKLLVDSFGVKILSCLGIVYTRAYGNCTCIEALERADEVRDFISKRMNCPIEYIPCWQVDTHTEKLALMGVSVKIIEEKEQRTIKAIEEILEWAKGNYVSIFEEELVGIEEDRDPELCVNLPYALGPLLKLEENEQLVPIKEAVQKMLGPHFPDSIWEGHIKMWQDIYTNLTGHKHTFGEWLSLFLYTSSYPLKSTSSKFHQYLNTQLVSDGREERIRNNLKHYLNYLVSAMRKIDIYTSPSQYLYRGIDQNVGVLVKKYIIGETVIWHAFSSTTTDEKIARGFMKGKYGTLFKIKDYCSGRPVNNFTPFPKECEILIPAGSRFEVVNVWYEKDCCVIELKQVRTLDEVLALELM